ncbi:LamG domain-containing protein [Candidatus Poribacteria bacterium]|nr:LamG domain-containing protein [Candidatus Poribacteria bacterium]MYG05257.1 LamG domain-containing protein [Candidatus Poribacteria bacterium]MYK22203.1 LamG domain-containing protein [Candidatus Poribacteria bacterium]
MLGTRWKAFSFARSSEDADDGDGLLTYLNAANASEMNKWYHVVGTYDSKEMKIYVNGKLEGTSGVQSGRINYPDRIFFSIGVYKDDMVSHLTTGDRINLHSRRQRWGRAAFSRRSSVCCMRSSHPQ